MYFLIFPFPLAGLRVAFGEQYVSWATSKIQQRRHWKSINHTTAAQVLGTLDRLEEHIGDAGGTDEDLLQTAMSEDSGFSFAKALLEQGRTPKYVSSQVYTTSLDFSVIAEMHRCTIS